MKQVVIGIDFGTLSVRAVAFNKENGEEIAQAVYDYPHGCLDRSLPDGTPVGLNECFQDPHEYEDGLSYVVRSVLNDGRIDPEDVVSVGVDFTFCTVLPVDEKGTPLCYLDKYKSRPQAYVKMWKHHGAQKEADLINALAEERKESFLSWSGGKVSSEYLLPKIFETLNKDPEVFHEMAYFLEAGDWIVWKLTGHQKRNLSMAGYRGLYRNGFPSRTFLKALDPQLEDLEDTVLKAEYIPAGSFAGVISPEGAELTGLKEGTIVAACQGDCYATVPASGVIENDAVVAVIGTSSVCMLQQDEEKNIPGSNGVVYSGMLEGKYGFEAGQCCVGDHFAWFTQNMVPEAYVEAAEEEGVSVFTYLQEKAAALKAGESGLIALDWWNGTRSLLMDGELTGMLLGCTLKTKPEEIYRALVEATAYGTRLILESFRENGLRIKRFAAAGGITYKDPFVMQTYADILNMDIEVASTTECGALGSAIYALKAAGSENGGYDSYEEAVAHMVRPPRAVYHPDKENVPVYDRLFKEYRTLHDFFGRDEESPMKQLLKIKKEAVNEA